MNTSSPVAAAIACGRPNGTSGVRGVWLQGPHSMKSRESSSASKQAGPAKGQQKFGSQPKKGSACVIPHKPVLASLKVPLCFRYTQKPIGPEGVYRFKDTPHVRWLCPERTREKAEKTTPCQKVIQVLFTSQEEIQRSLAS